MAARRVFVLAVLLAASMLAACQSAPIVETTGTLSIRSVSVQMKPGIQAASDLRAAVEQAASAELKGGDAAGKPARVVVSIDQVGYRNVVEQLVVPSANAMTTTVTVYDATDTALTSFRESVVLDPAFGGVMGAAGALMQDRAAVDRGFAQAYAAKLRTRLLGPAGYQPRGLPPSRAGAPSFPRVGPYLPPTRQAGDGEVTPGA